MKPIQKIPALFVLIFTLASQTFAQQLQTLYNFGQPPNSPYGGVVFGPDNNFYGTAYQGGKFGFGAVFQLTPGGVLTDLFDFDTADGAYPYAGLLSDQHGNFYGVTQYGGTIGYGVIFRINTNGVLTVLTNLDLSLGANPLAALIVGADGNLYGTTANGGGSTTNGAIFQISTNGAFKTIAVFSGANGASPQGSLYQAPNGTFYGTTASGGMGGFGTVFSLTTAGTLTSLASFDSLTNGASPTSTLAADAAGNLYGTTSSGGGGNGTGSGTLFEIPVTNQNVILPLYTFTGGNTPHAGLLAVSGNTFYGTSQTSLYKFTSTNQSVQIVATLPLGAFAGVISDASGNIYGTTHFGGAHGFGEVYEYTTNGSLLPIFSFNTSLGDQPIGGLVQDDTGTLYGTTYSGGPADNGTIFSLATNGILTPLVDFNSQNGAYPSDTLLLTNGFLYGTTYLGGGNGGEQGTVFNVTTAGLFFNTRTIFESTNGAYPLGGLIRDAGGSFYGTTAGQSDINFPDGSVYKLTNFNVITLAKFNFTNGAFPASTLAFDGSGNVWGDTPAGGPTGNGTIFKIPTNGMGTNALVPFLTFNGVNGSLPTGPLTLGSDGAFYGTTKFGGAHNFGVVYRATTNGSLTAIHSFAGGDTGAYPLGGVVAGSNGVFYGTTSGLGNNVTNGSGTIFRISTNGTFATLLVFNGTNGSGPSGSLLVGMDGGLYGTTQFGGALGSGTIFKLLINSVTPIPLAIQQIGSHAVLTWANPVFNLQASTNSTGPYTNVPNTSSPYTNTFNARQTFFRLQAD